MLHLQWQWPRARLLPGSCWDDQVSITKGIALTWYLFLVHLSVCRHWTALVEHTEGFRGKPSVFQGAPETCCILLLFSLLLTKSSASLKCYKCSAIRQTGLQSLACKKGGKIRAEGTQVLVLFHNQSSGLIIEVHKLKYMY